MKKVKGPLWFVTQAIDVAILGAPNDGAARSGAVSILMSTLNALCSRGRRTRRRERDAARGGRKPAVSPKPAATPAAKRERTIKAKTRQRA